MLQLEHPKLSMHLQFDYDVLFRCLAFVVCESVSFVPFWSVSDTTLRNDLKREKNNCDISFCWNEIKWSDICTFVFEKFLKKKSKSKSRDISQQEIFTESKCIRRNEIKRNEAFFCSCCACVCQRSIQFRIHRNPKYIFMSSFKRKNVKKMLA